MDDQKYELKILDVKSEKDMEDNQTNAKNSCSSMDALYESGSKTDALYGSGSKTDALNESGSETDSAEYMEEIKGTNASEDHKNCSLDSTTGEIQPDNALEVLNMDMTHLTLENKADNNRTFDDERDSYMLSSRKNECDNKTSETSEPDANVTENILEDNQRNISGLVEGKSRSMPISAEQIFNQVIDECSSGNSKKESAAPDFEPMEATKGTLSLESTAEEIDACLSQYLLKLKPKLALLVSEIRERKSGSKNKQKDYPNKSANIFMPETTVSKIAESSYSNASAAENDQQINHDVFTDQNIKKESATPNTDGQVKGISNFQSTDVEIISNIIKSQNDLKQKIIAMRAQRATKIGSDKIGQTCPQEMSTNINVPGSEDSKLAESNPSQASINATADDTKMEGLDDQEDGRKYAAKNEENNQTLQQKSPEIIHRNATQSTDVHQNESCFANERALKTELKDGEASFEFHRTANKDDGMPVPQQQELGVLQSDNQAKCSNPTQPSPSNPSQANISATADDTNMKGVDDQAGGHKYAAENEENNQTLQQKSPEILHQNAAQNIEVQKDENYASETELKLEKQTSEASFEYHSVANKDDGMQAPQEQESEEVMNNDNQTSNLDKREGQICGNTIQLSGHNLLGSASQTSKMVSSPSPKGKKKTDCGKFGLERGVCSKTEAIPSKIVTGEVKKIQCVFSIEDKRIADASAELARMEGASAALARMSEILLSENITKLVEKLSGESKNTQLICLDFLDQLLDILQKDIQFLPERLLRNEFNNFKLINKSFEQAKIEVDKFCKSIDMVLSKHVGMTGFLKCICESINFVFVLNSKLEPCIKPVLEKLRIIDESIVKKGSKQNRQKRIIAEVVEEIGTLNALTLEIQNMFNASFKK